MAEGGQFSQEKEDVLKRLGNSLQCSICMEQYKDPRMLSCQHSFCAKCLKQHVGDSDIIRCPLCNNESAKPAEGIDGLMPNYLIRCLIEDVIGQKLEMPSELKPKRKCGNCDEANDAVSNCEDCGCDLCTDCMDMHRKMKALKNHNISHFPTEEELLEEMKVECKAKVEKITHNIHEKEAQLKEKISSLRKKIGEIEKKREAEQIKLRESHRELLVKIDEYVQQLSTKINSSAADRLGDMPEGLVACEQQLKTYKNLKQQGWMISNIQIDKRIERCQKLIKQISDLQLRSQASVYRGGNEDVVAPEFVASEVTQSQLLASMINCLGYVKPLPSRFDRKVEISHEKNVAPDMRESAIQAMHDALDHIGMYPTTHASLKAVLDWDFKDTLLSGTNIVSSWYSEHLTGSPTKEAGIGATTDKKKTIDFVALTKNKDVWSELRTRHEQLSVEHEKARDEFRHMRQVVVQLENDYTYAKDNLMFRRYSLLKAMIKRCVVYVNLRQDSGAGQRLTTGKQRQEMRNREESIAGLSTQDLSILNKQLQGLIQEHKCKTALIVDMLQTLERKYEHSKQYSAVRRYRMLKSIVKAVIHNQWLQE